MHRQFNPLIQAAGGDGEKGTICNIKFGVKFHKKIIKLPNKNNLIIFFSSASQGVVLRWKRKKTTWLCDNCGKQSFSCRI